MKIKSTDIFLLPLWINNNWHIVKIHKLNVLHRYRSQNNLRAKYIFQRFAPKHFKFQNWFLKYSNYIIFQTVLLFWIHTSITDVFFLHCIILVKWILFPISLIRWLYLAWFICVYSSIPWRSFLFFVDTVSVILSYSTFETWIWHWFLVLSVLL